MGNTFHKAIFIVTIAYLVIVSLFLVWHRAWFSPDQFYAVALGITLLLGKFKQFIRDWSAPVILFLSYEYLRGLVPKLSLEVNIHPMINFDKSIFGSIPTIKLQSLLFTSGVLRWYDYMAVVLYIIHFIVPMIVGFIFWLTDKKHFKDYLFSLVILSYMAFITYIIYPAMPPWMASEQGIIPPIARIMDQVFKSFADPLRLPSFYQLVSVNQVAAVPSLHAAFPWLTLLFMVRRFKYKGLLVFPYVLGVWFAIVYLGEHYVFDIVPGVLYATFAFFVVTKRAFLIRKIKPLLKFRRKSTVTEIMELSKD